MVSQESTVRNGHARKAIDGNTNGRFRSVGTCTHTMEPESCPRSDGAAWWRLEFPTEVQIDWVKIWNRIGGQSKRIDKVKVFLDRRDRDRYICGEIEYIKKENRYNYTISCGGIVTKAITIENNCVLTLCEVEVFTSKPPRLCSGYTVKNGTVYPAEVIEGSIVNISCDLGFRMTGKSRLMCKNGTVGELPRCIPLEKDECKPGTFGGFLQYICQDGQNKDKITMKCANSDIIYHITRDSETSELIFSHVCENDNKFYQACGSFGRTDVYAIDTEKLFCGGYICKDRGKITSATCWSQKTPGSCDNIKKKEELCTNELDGENNLIEKCDGICNQQSKCLDEAYCNGFTYGRNCEENHFYLSVLRTSEREKSSKNKKCKVFDSWPENMAAFLENYTEPVCEQTISKKVFPIFNFTRCAAFRYDQSAVFDPDSWWITSTKMPYCTNLMDQTNCTDLSRVAFSCTVNGYSTNISRLAICHEMNEVRLCDDGLENDCKHVSPSCFLHKHKMCDGIIDCLDESDEQSVECNRTTEKTCIRVYGNRSLPTPITWLGDGIADCVSGEESMWPTCGEGETKRFVRDNGSCHDDYLCPNSETKFVPWTQLCDMIETCGNENTVCSLSKGKTNFIIITSVKSLKGLETSTGLLNKMLIILFSFGDFLVAGYLFTISAADFIYGPSYCSSQTEWLSSHYCSILGILSTVGSQISLFSMTFLSVARLFGIKNAMSIPRGLSFKFCIEVSAVVFLIVFSAITIATVPILSQFENFFVNGMSYKKIEPMFLGLPDKDVHLQVVNAYYGRAKGDKSSISWKTILELIDGMFTKLYSKGLSRRKVDFYGNDGVCLFKYFVTDGDPQRIFSWAILTVNLTCFVCISISYFIITTLSVNSSRSVVNEQISKRNRKMQRKISIIIATDFCCWIPFVVICCLHSLSVLDATPWYSLFSIVILPINSLINPLLYDSTLFQYISRPLRGARRTVRDFVSSIGGQTDQTIVTETVSPGSSNIKMSDMTMGGQKKNKDIPCVETQSVYAYCEEEC
ncbi:hypothetical protein ACHWQZ_G011812 [Mnemiopsis leidyi]